MSESNCCYSEVARVKDGQSSYRLITLSNSGVKDAFGFRRMNYSKEGTDFRDGKFNVPLHVAHEFALAILRETVPDLYRREARKARARRAEAEMGVVDTEVVQ